MNVCGLKKKLTYPDFNEIIQTHDICIFVETKLSDLDVLNVPTDYLYYTKIETNQKTLPVELQLFIKLILKIISNLLELKAN